MQGLLLLPLMLASSADQPPSTPIRDYYIQGSMQMGPAPIINPYYAAPPQEPSFRERVESFDPGPSLYEENRPMYEEMGVGE